MESEYQLSKNKPTTLDLSFAKIMRNVYAWMTGGLVITALTALIVANSPILLEAIFSSSATIWVIFIAEIALVWILSSRIERMSFITAGLMFAAYSILTGLTFSTIFLVYSIDAIVQTFFITAGVFGVMSIVGMTVKKDLSTLGRILLMALVGVIIATIVNILMHNSGLAMVINYLGVIIFVGLTAYDTQKIKQMSLSYSGEEEMGNKLAVWGSLMLYLDFINLFLYILRLFGSKK